MVETIIGDRKKSGYGHGASPLFIKLPAELRLEIYREAFSGSQATIEGASLEQDSREDQTQESLRIRPGTNFEGDPEPRQIPHRRAAGQDARQLCGKGVVAFFGHFKRPRTFRLDDAFDVIYSVFDSKYLRRKSWIYSSTTRLASCLRRKLAASRMRRASRRCCEMHSLAEGLGQAGGVGNKVTVN